MQVGLGQCCPTASAIHVHLHAYAGTAVLVELVLGIGDNVTLQRSTAIALCHTDSIKLIPVRAFAFAHALDTPLQLNVGGEDVLCFGSSEQFADGVHIALVSETYYTTVCALSQLQLAQQGVLLLEALDFSLTCL